MSTKMSIWEAQRKAKDPDSSSASSLICASSVFQRAFEKSRRVPPPLKRLVTDAEDLHGEGVVLDLRNQQLGDVFVEALCQGHTALLEKAAEVQLGANGLSDKAVECLAKVLGPGLKHLGIEENKITSVGCDWINAFFTYGLFGDRRSSTALA